MVVYQGFQIKPHKDTPTCYVIVTDGKGGKIPDILAGLFTSPSIAKLAIDAYVNYKTKKDSADAKAGTTG